MTKSPPPRPAPSRHVTSYDVARRAGVSQSAVSRCFSPGGSISRAMRTRIEKAAADLGYTPNAIARSLITSRSGLVGLLVTDATLRSSPTIIHDLSDALESAQLIPLLATLAREGDVAQVLPRILHYRPEAVISLATVGSGLIADATRRAIPIVLVNRAAPPGVHAASIRCDHVEAVSQLVGRLITAGHRRLAFLAGPRGAPVSEERLKGFRLALRRGRLKAAAVAYADYSYEGGRAAAASLLRGRSRPDAIVCANDAMAIGVLDCCRVDLGRAVPRDISVTGFDDIPEGSRPTRDLTTVAQPTRAMARAAVDILRRARSEDVTAVEVLISGEMRIRGSARIERG